MPMGSKPKAFFVFLFVTVNWDLHLYEYKVAARVSISGILIKFIIEMDM